MKNKGFVQFLVILLAVVCLYQLSFTLVTRNVEKKVREEAWSMVGNDTPSYARTYKTLIDSMRSEEVYPVFGLSYNECKQREINLGLDLQGGMNVTLEISTPSMIRELAGEEDDTKFIEAMDKAEAAYLGQGSFVDYFQTEYEAINPEKGLARIFYTKNRKSELPNQLKSTNEEVYEWLKREEKAQVGETYKVVKTRIDQFNVTQPNVQQLDNGRILVELPGVDNPDRVIGLIQQSAKLEFWEVFNNDDIYKHFEDARSVISAKLKIEQEKADSAAGIVEPEVADTDAGLDLDGVDEPALELATDSSEDITLTADGQVADAAADSNEIDTSAQNQEELTAEEQLIEFPLMSRMALPRDGDQVLIRNFVGYVHETQKEFFETWLTGREEDDGSFTKPDPEVLAQFPDNVKFRWSYSKTEDGFYTLYALRGGGRDNGPVLDGDVIDNARPTISPNGSNEVNMLMNSTAAKEWKLITEHASTQTPQEAIAIVLDDKVYSAPTVNGTIPNGSSSISGDFSIEEAEDLANILKAGRINVPTRIVEQTVVGPTLGDKAIKAGLISLVVGFLSVIVFMFFYYGRAGAYAVLALLANLFFILGVLSGYGAALTLPGMAGLVLTIGMAVDANVIIFERIREELLDGAKARDAIAAGYGKAFSAVMDANITTGIAGLVLLQFGTGPIKGFAVTLLVGIVGTIFTAVFVSRLIFDMWITGERSTQSELSI